MLTRLRGPIDQKEVQLTMAKISANYEVVFIIDGNKTEEAAAACSSVFSKSREAE